MEHLAVLAALGFASYRVTQLVVHDTIGDPLRARLAAWHMNGVGPGRSNRVRSFFWDLSRCTFCVGFHASWLTVLVYLLATGTNPVGSFSSFWLFGIQSFAVAGIQAILSRYEDTLPGGNN